jgi:hypothetical protein
MWKKFLGYVVEWYSLLIFQWWFWRRRGVDHRDEATAIENERSKMGNESMNDLDLEENDRDGGGLVNEKVNGLESDFWMRGSGLVDWVSVMENEIEPLIR